MKRYHVYKYPTGIIKVVKYGWSWPAFLFGFLWAIVKGLWGVVLIIILLSVLIIKIPNYPGEADNLMTIFGVIVGLMLGFIGNGLIENKLRRQGYKLVGKYEARTSKEAIAKYLREGQSMK